MSESGVGESEREKERPAAEPYTINGHRKLVNWRIERDKLPIKTIWLVKWINTNARHIELSPIIVILLSSNHHKPYLNNSKAANKQCSARWNDVLSDLRGDWMVWPEQGAEPKPHGWMAVCPTSVTQGNRITSAMERCGVFRRSMVILYVWCRWLPICCK